MKRGARKIMKDLANHNLVRGKTFNFYVNNPRMVVPIEAPDGRSNLSSGQSEIAPLPVFRNFDISSPYQQGMVGGYRAASSAAVQKENRRRARQGLLSTSQARFCCCFGHMLLHLCFNNWKPRTCRLLFDLCCRFSSCSAAIQEAELHREYHPIQEPQDALWAKTALSPFSSMFEIEGGYIPAFAMASATGRLSHGLHSRLFIEWDKFVALGRYDKFAESLPSLSVLERSRLDENNPGAEAAHTLEDRRQRFFLKRSDKPLVSSPGRTSSRSDTVASSSGQKHSDFAADESFVDLNSSFELEPDDGNECIDQSSMHISPSEAARNAHDLSALQLSSRSIQSPIKSSHGAPVPVPIGHANDLKVDARSNDCSKHDKAPHLGAISKRNVASIPNHKETDAAVFDKSDFDAVAQAFGDDQFAGSRGGPTRRHRPGCELDRTHAGPCLVPWRRSAALFLQSHHDSTMSQRQMQVLASIFPSASASSSIAADLPLRSPGRCEQSTTEVKAASGHCGSRSAVAMHFESQRHLVDQLRVPQSTTSCFSVPLPPPPSRRVRNSSFPVGTATSDNVDCEKLQLQQEIALLKAQLSHIAHPTPKPLTEDAPLEYSAQRSPQNPNCSREEAGVVAPPLERCVQVSSERCSEKPGSPRTSITQDGENRSTALQETSSHVQNHATPTSASAPAIQPPDETFCAVCNRNHLPAKIVLCDGAGCTKE